MMLLQENVNCALHFLRAFPRHIPESLYATLCFTVFYHVQLAVLSVLLWVATTSNPRQFPVSDLIKKECLIILPDYLTWPGKKRKEKLRRQ